MPKDAAPQAIHRKDYRPPDYRTERTALEFDLEEGCTEVRSRLRIRREAGADADAPLVLDGRELELVSVHLDGRPLSGNEFQVDDESLRLYGLPDAFELEIRTRIKPEENTALEGLYRSGGMYCTHCEAEGFRKITYYQDRPDVLSKFTTSIKADAERFPVLLANGNLTAERREGSHRIVTWEDPFPKPCYLFALVAGDLACMTGQFTSMSGRRVELRLYSEPRNIGQCEYALGALQRAMRWDEQRFGREYDLDIYMIVAVEDFNMGAMENKGLNIFNTSCVLAAPDTATDATYQRVEGIIAHEYFHNWSGNRVTCRDWFQLSLKEGFTVFRDAEFSSDMHSRTVKRIEDVCLLRTEQFAEDGGPLAHPVRPDSYIEISNFYTHTVYEKGAEVVGMAARLLGWEGFRKGCDLYFARHDGQAVATEDFVKALEDASGADLGQFRLWYAQAGTPLLKARTAWREGALHIDIRQSCPPTPGQPDKRPMHIPVLLGLLGADGRELAGDGLEVAGDAQVEWRGASLLLHLREATASLQVHGLNEEPRLSFLRGFSAPVRVQLPRSPETLAFLARHDSDGFARWDAMQSLLVGELNSIRGGGELSQRSLELFADLIAQAERRASDPEAGAMLRMMLTPPSESYLLEQEEQADLEAVIRAWDQLITALAEALSGAWRSLYEAAAPKGPYAPDPAGMARRGLRNLALGYLSWRGGEEAHARLLAHLQAADNLTDRLAALSEIADSADFPNRQQVLDGFYQHWRRESLVVNQWLRIQAASRCSDAQALDRLEQHPGFDPRNPNKLRALYGTFGHNHRNFHAADGAGYRLLANRLADLDARNPQMAARLLTPLTRWRKFDPGRQSLMRRALEGIRARDGLSKDLFEVVAKSLDG